MYDATVDDYIRAFMQCTNYNSFLNGGRPGTGPSKQELRLCPAQRSGRPEKVVEVMKNMPEAKDWCTRTPHFEGEEVFGSTVRKADLPIGSEFDSHRPDKMSFSRLKVQTRATNSQRGSALPVTHRSPPPSPTSSDDVQVLSPPASAPPAPAPPVDAVATAPATTTFVAPALMRHVTSVYESECDVWQLHIARVLKTSSKKCFAIQARSRRNCQEKIVRMGKSTPAPTYTG